MGTVSFTWEEIQVLYITYATCGYLPTDKREVTSTRGKIDMLRFIMLCEAKYVDYERLIEKVESYSKWNEFTRTLLKSIYSHLNIK